MDNGYEVDHNGKFWYTSSTNEVWYNALLSSTNFWLKLSQNIEFLNTEKPIKPAYYDPYIYVAPKECCAYFAEFAKEYWPEWDFIPIWERRLFVEIIVLKEKPTENDK